MKKRVVITGATRGCGRALAEYFAAEGWIVHGCGRDPAAVAELAAALQPPHTVEAVDVSLDHEVAAWASALLPTGAPDLLINNAALIARPAPLWKLQAAEVDPVVDANIKGTINTIRHFVPAMIARGSGVIANFSSGWGRSTSPEVAVYCATKWAIEGLTAALAQELPHGLAAVAVNPGIIRTSMLRTCWGDNANSYPPPEEWVLAAGPFLASLGPRHNGRPLTVPGVPT